VATNIQNDCHKYSDYTKKRGVRFHSKAFCLDVGYLTLCQIALQSFAKRVDSFPLGAGRWRFDSSRHAECHQRNIPLPPEAFGCGDRQANSPGFISQGNRLSCQSKIATDFHYMETGLFCGVQSKWKTRAPSPERSGGPKAARKRRHWNESCGGVRTGKPNKLAGPRVWSRFNGSRNLALCGE